MENCKLMTSLFYKDMFNREGRKMRAVFEREVSNGTETYRIWRSAGKPDLDYPRAENDKYILHVELNGYLVPLRLTDYTLIDICGFQAAAEKLYGGSANRGQHFDALRESGGDDAVLAAVAEERAEIVRIGGEPARQANYIQTMLAEHTQTYLKAKENGGTSFPDFIGALLADDLARCVELSAAYREKCRRERDARAARAAEEDRAYCEERNSVAEQTVSKAIQILLDGGELENETVRFYRSRYDSSAYSVVNHLMRLYHIDVPLRTQGWINERLSSATIKDGKCECLRFLRSKKGRCSQKFFACMNDLIRAVTAQTPEHRGDARLIMARDHASGNTTEWKKF